MIVEPLTGYVVEPLLYGHSTGLSPLSVIVAAVFWTWIWGPVGLILSTPLTLCLVVMGRHVEVARVLRRAARRPAGAVGSEPLLPAHARQRPDETLDQAEKMLADRSLVDYYDSVVLPGLKLAAVDEARGMISRPARCRDDPLHSRRHQRPRGARRVQHMRQRRVTNGSGKPAAGVVACVAGRGPFDEVVSAMLAQLLAQRGVAARRIPHTFAVA